MLIAELFVLLALDPVSGHLRLPHPDTDPDLLCSAGLLVDLLLQRRLRAAAPDHLEVDASLPSSHSLLTSAADAVAAAAKPDAASAILQVRRRHSHLTRNLLEGLYRRDLLHRVRDWRFWRADSLRYPLRSAQARNDAASCLQQACDNPDDMAGLGLLLLADVAGVMTRHLHARHHERASRILLGLNGATSDDTPRAALALIRNALLA